MNKFYDVIIGGGGPVGLLLACELGLAGVSVLVLERDAHKTPHMMNKPLGMRGMNVLSSESFYRRGLLNEFIETIDTSRIGRFGTGKFAGHFAGILLDSAKFDLSRWKYRVPGPSLSPRRTDLARIESVLTARAESLGIEIIRGSAVTGHSQDEEGVTVLSGDKTYSARYLVGCDGGRSTIRKQGGFEFKGTDAQFTGYTALCDLDDPEKIPAGWQKMPGGLALALETGWYGVMDFDGGTYDRTKEVTREHFESVLQRVSGTDVRVTELRYASTFTDRALLAENYRNGRVFLAGDSAHIHSPLGGQGLNAGFGDAMNLGWKLAATIKGHAPENLLDTYNSERHPIGEWITEWTRAQVNILQPGLFGDAAYKLIKDLLDTNDGTDYFADHVWGLSQRYDLGSEHPLVGVSAPEFEFVDGTRLGDKMHNGKGLLVDFTNDSLLQEIASNYSAGVNYINAPVKDTLGLKSLLVRPDGIVCWLNEDGVNPESIHTVLRTWFNISVSEFALK